MTEEKKALPIVLDATMMDTFLDCPCKFDYRHNKNKTTASLAPALDRGILEHIGFEAYYTGLKDKLSFSDCIQKSREAFNLAVLESDLDNKETSFLLRVLEENLTYWRAADNKFDIVAVEQPFSYELFSGDVNGINVRLIMMGKIDLLVNDNQYSNLPYDHKTYSRDFPVYRKMNQFCNYAYATKSNHLVVNRVGLQASLPPEKKHKRVPLSFDPFFLEQWKQNVIKWIGFYLDCVINNQWPMNDTSCNKYNRLCEYYPVCDSSGQEAKEYKLTANFKTNEPWDVARSLGLKKD